MAYVSYAQRKARKKNGERFAYLLASIAVTPILDKEQKMLTLDELVKDTRCKILAKKYENGDSIMYIYNFIEKSLRLKERYSLKLPALTAYRTDELLTFEVIVRSICFIKDMERRIKEQFRDYEDNIDFYRRVMVYTLGLALRHVNDVSVEYCYNVREEFFIKAVKDTDMLIVTEDLKFYNGEEYYKPNKDGMSIRPIEAHPYSELSEAMDLFKGARYLTYHWVHENRKGLLEFEDWVGGDVKIARTLEEMMSLVNNRGMLTFIPFLKKEEMDTAIEEIKKDEKKLDEGFEDMVFSRSLEALETFEEKEVEEDENKEVVAEKQE